MPAKKQSPKALSFQRQFTRDDVSPYDMFDYDYRTSVIKNPSGEVVFQMDDVEVPKQWSQIATDILAQKYFRKAGVPKGDGTTGRETTVKQEENSGLFCSSSIAVDLACSFQEVRSCRLIKRWL